MQRVPIINMSMACASSATAALREQDALAVALREQDALAVARRLLPQPDGSLIFAEYDGGGGRLPAELDALAGVYTASVDGMYVVGVWPSQRLDSDVGFLTLVQRHAATGTSVHRHVDGSSCDGGLLHLREKDTLCVVASPVESGGAAGRLASALRGMSVSLRVELAMRKRKRAEDLADLDEQEAEAAARAAAKAVAKRKRGALAAPDEEEEGTGSDTEWSEGFSSDDEARRQARPPKRVRALARAARAQLECGDAAPSEDEDDGDAVVEAQEEGEEEREEAGGSGGLHG